MSAVQEVVSEVIQCGVADESRARIFANKFGDNVFRVVLQRMVPLLL